MNVQGATSRARVPDTPSPAERVRLAAELGGVLRRERVARGWSQNDLDATAGLGARGSARLEGGGRRVSETTTRRLAEALRPGGSPVAVARLDLELQRAAGPSLRRWVRRRPMRERRRRAYEEAAAQLAAERAPSLADAVLAQRLRAAFTRPSEFSEGGR